MNLHLKSHEICFINVLTSFIIVIILNIVTFTYFVLLKTLTTGFKSIGLYLIIHDSLFNYTHLVAKDPLKLNNAINTV